ncbi:hypothetical protein F4802DRAFT_574318, partial [Xylaria palmicola]
MSCISFGSFTARLQRLVGLKSKAAAAAVKDKHNSCTMQISAPFNFKHEAISLPGLSEDDIAALKEEAAAARRGAVAAARDDNDSVFGLPRQVPRTPPSPSPIRDIA